MILASVKYANLELFKKKRENCSLILETPAFKLLAEEEEQENQMPREPGVRARGECCLVCLEKLFFQGGSQMYVLLLK